MNDESLDYLPIGIFDLVPIYVLCIGIILILLISFEFGYQLSKYTTEKYDKEGSSTIGPMVSGLLAMLAFVLAFTFAMASAQYNLRKEYVLDEANIIGTAYLRADLIGEQDGAEIKKLLKEYLDSRIYAIEKADLNLIKTAMKRSKEIHNLLWQHVSSASKREPNLTVFLLIQSINDVIDIQQKRITAGFYNRIPNGVWLVLLIISVLTMITIGTQARLSNSRRLIAVIPLIIAFSALIAMVLDLDRPQQGMLKIGQDALVELQRSLDQTSK